MYLLIKFYKEYLLINHLNKQTHTVAILNTWLFNKRILGIRSHWAKIWILVQVRKSQSANLIDTNVNDKSM